MRVRGAYLSGGVLPTAIAVSLVILAGLAGLLCLWEWESLLFARNEHLRRVRADAESAFLLYSRHPDAEMLAGGESYSLYDSLPEASVRVAVRPWGLYEAVGVAVADSSLCLCRILGAEPDTETLFYADNRSSPTLAGQTVLQGGLAMPSNGFTYGRMGADFFSGEEIPRSSVSRSEPALPAPGKQAELRIEALFARMGEGALYLPPDSLHRSFIRDSTAWFRVGDVRLAECVLRGNIVLCGGEVHIGASCRLKNVLICARKVVVEPDARFAAQVFARDTVLVGAGAVLEYPSGIYAQGYVSLGEDSRLDGYVVVRDTVQRKKMAANYLQSRTARLRGLLYVDGVAQVQGIVAGRMCLRQSAYFSPQGYYKDMFYEVTLLENPLTALPLYAAEAPARRKEVVCVD